MSEVDGGAKEFTESLNKEKVILCILLASCWFVFVIFGKIKEINFLSARIDFVEVADRPHVMGVVFTLIFSALAYTFFRWILGCIEQYSILYSNDTSSLRSKIVDVEESLNQISQKLDQFNKKDNFEEDRNHIKFLANEIIDHIDKDFISIDENYIENIIDSAKIEINKAKEENRDLYQVIGQISLYCESGIRDLFQGKRFFLDQITMLNHIVEQNTKDKYEVEIINLQKTISRKIRSINYRGMMWSASKKVRVAVFDIAIIFIVVSSSICYLGWNMSGVLVGAARFVLSIDNSMIAK